MDLSIAEVQIKDDLSTYYYPSYTASWIVKVRTIFGFRNEKVITFGDGVTCDIGMAEEVPRTQCLKVEDEYVIPNNMTREDFQLKSLEALRKYFIYKRRVWEEPIIECEEIKFFFIPYQVGEKKGWTGRKKKFLFEPLSGCYDDIKNHKGMENYLIRKGVHMK